MKINDAYGRGKFVLSFELFPPKTTKGDQALLRHLDELVKFKPGFITCTYGAGGSTREKTLDIVQQVHQRYGCSVAAHLTCVGSKLDDLRSFLVDAQRREIENVVALRGDPPRGETGFKPVEGGFSFASELVQFIRSEFPAFGIAVAGYPETHQEATSPQADLENLKRKVDAGGDVVITQLFYDNSDFFRFQSDCHQRGIDVPIVPGILPITNFAQIQRITSLCGAKLPAELVSALTNCGDDEERQFEVGIQFATQQVQELVDSSIPGIHFYVLNKSDATAGVLRNVQGI